MVFIERQRAILSLSSNRRRSIGKYKNAERGAANKKLRLLGVLSYERESQCVRLHCVHEIEIAKVDSVDCSWQLFDANGSLSVGGWSAGLQS